jgi:hypothetical protein
MYNVQKHNVAARANPRKIHLLIPRNVQNFNIAPADSNRLLAYIRVS